MNIIATAGQGHTGTAALQLPPLSLYIHIPWCVRKCPYCDFNSHQQNGKLPEPAYIDALLQDFRQELAYVQGRRIASIFFGGGTPSLFSASGLDRLLRGIADLAPFMDDIEISLEANPGTAERQKFADYRRIGITRLSIGIQSFDDRQLQNLGRIHGSEDGRQAIAFARAAGFDNINLDIMYGLQKQSLAAALADLQEAANFAPEHISWYQLTIEQNTEFFKRPPPLPAENTLLAIQDAGLALLDANGFRRYEVSAFAQDGRRARHNMNYWLFGDYIGIGAGAHGKITVPGQHCIVRTRKTRQPGAYMQAALASETNFTAETLPVEPGDLVLEFMLNALRLTEGFTVADFETRTGLPYATLAAPLQALQSRGLLRIDAERVATTARGMQFLNTVLEEFV